MPSRDTVEMTGVKLPVGTDYTDGVKVTAAGYPVLRRGRWHVALPVILDKQDLLRMLAAMEGMGAGDMEG